MTLFGHRWMVYDRYGQFKFGTAIPVSDSESVQGGAQGSVPCLEPAAPAAARRTDPDGPPRPMSASLDPTFDTILQPSESSPVPNTEYKKSRHPHETTLEQGEELVLTPDALDYYKKAHEKREELADDVRAETGECEFQLGNSLRVTWIPAQRSDKTLSMMFAGLSLIHI